MKGARFPPSRTPVPPAEMAPALVHAWSDIVGTAPTASGIHLLLAQWALETGRGRALMNWNVGNVKANLWQDHTYFPTTEYLPIETAYAEQRKATPAQPMRIAKIIKHAGQPPKARCVFSPDHPTCRFRAFASLQDGTNAYMRLLRARFRPAWDAVEAGDPVRFVHLLKVGRYFTAPEEDYRKPVVSLFEEFGRANHAQI